MNSCLTHTINPNLLTPRTSRRSIIFRQKRRLNIVAESKKSSFGCGLNAPLQPSTTAGKFLCGSLLDGCDGLQDVARNELHLLADSRDSALARMQFSIGSDQACLHRRIAELKTVECEKVVEDIMYVLALHKFSEIGVHLIPPLLKCICNGRLEICPPKTWELESIYSSEVLEVVRDHLNGIIGLKENSDINQSWVTTEMSRGRLCKYYASSLLFGYFLKSASLRYQLESGLQSVVSEQIPGLDPIPVLGTYQLGMGKNTAFGCITSPVFAPVGELLRKEESLSSYVMAFDAKVIKMCANPKSKEAMDLIKRHSCALFGHEETDQVILTSFASMKRLVLEAVAFGYFLWDIESWVNTVYTLGENREV